jgi:FtsZ-binding cell division protein ZapB
MPLPLFVMPVLGFVRNNWQLIAVGLAVLALVTYIGVLRWQVDHYKEKFQEVSAELASAQKREDVLKAEAEGITKKYAASLVETKKEIEKNAKYIEDLVQKDVELNTLRISYSAVGLFNLSKRNPSSPTPKAVKGDDGKTGTADASGSANGLGKSVTLASVFKIIALNDGNHWKCVKQVEDWQGFWRDYEGAVIRAGAAGG